MKVLITGGAGYIGSKLTRKLLDEGHQVTVYDNLMYKQTGLLSEVGRPGFVFVKGDVRNEEDLGPLVKKADIIIPLAAIVGMPACSIAPEVAWQVNLDSLDCILDEAKTEAHIIYPTTNSGYGKTKETKETKGQLVYCDENTPLNPISVYGESKVQAEKHLRDFGATSLRLATVFGVSPRMRMDLLVNDFTYRSCRDGFLVLYESHFKRNYIHIDDVVRTFIFAIEHPEEMKGETFNVGLSDANLSKMELAQLLKDMLGIQIFETKEGTDPDQRNYIVSNAKIEALGWKPTMSLKQGISELISAYDILSTQQNSLQTNL